MYRLVLIAALATPIAGLALTVDDTATSDVDVFEIRVASDDLSDCRETLAMLEQRPVVSDDGTWLPRFFVSEDLPESVCVVDASA